MTEARPPFMGEDRGMWKIGAKRAGRRAFYGARASIAGPVRLTFLGAVLGAASWVSHPSHDHINTKFDNAEHLDNASKELGKIKPQDEALQNIISEISNREEEIRKTGSFKWDAKRAQASYYAQILSGGIIAAGVTWYAERRRRSNSKIMESEEQYSTQGLQDPLGSDGRNHRTF